VNEDGRPLGRPVWMPGQRAPRKSSSRGGVKRFLLGRRIALTSGQGLSLIKDSWAASTRASSGVTGARNE